MSTRWLAPLSLVVLVMACESNPTGAPASSAAPLTTTSASAQVVTPAPPAPSNLGASYTDEQLPVPGDFEDAAAKAVNEGNYKEKLAELEAAIDGGPAASASAAPEASAAPPASAEPQASAAPKPSAAPATPAP